jgi:DNA-directed RNA polymerase subunit M/transcription elongation factor TFIIS
MPINELICPACSSHLKRPTSLRDGELFECPMCATEFRAGASETRSTSRRPARPSVEELEEVDEEASEQLEVLDDDDRPRKVKLTNRQRMKLVKLGLGFYYAKFLCTVVVFGLSALSMALALVPVVGLSMVPVIGCLDLILVPLTPFLGLVGGVLCFWVPQKSKGRLLVQIACGLDAGALLIAAGGVPFAWFFSFDMIRLVLAGSLLLFLAACILFMLFLRALAAHVRDYGTAEETIRVMITWLLTLFLPPFVLALLIAIAYSARSLQMAAIFIYAGTLIWLIIYTKVLLNLLNAISSVRQRIASRFNLD